MQQKSQIEELTEKLQVMDTRNTQKIGSACPFTHICL
jgi:hypothetical protein